MLDAIGADVNDPLQKAAAQYAFIVAQLLSASL
jgi:hypothetical protein